MLDAMQRQLSHDLTRDAQRLDNACRRYFGVTGRMFRTTKFLFYICTLIFTGYLIEFAGVTPLIAMLFAAFLITGPEGVETYLINQGVIEDDQGETQE